MIVGAGGTAGVRVLALAGVIVITGGGAEVRFGCFV